jgi:alpha-beta hydrolase superfamily lysophospholipase
MALAGGLVLLALAVAIPVAHRSTAPPRVAWRRRVVGTLAVLSFGGVVALPLGGAVVQTHPLRDAPPERPDSSYLDISLVTADGIKLNGWYRPSSNGKAVVLVPSASGSRRSVLPHAELLARHGYGVLVYDARGSGTSSGPRNAYGWGWASDVRAAIAFAAGRPVVWPDQVAGLGLSSGADVLIEVAADPAAGLAAVVADGATARSGADLDSLGSPLETWPLQATFAGIRLLTGTAPGAPLRQLAAELTGLPALFVAGGSIPQEIPLNEQYAAAAHAQMWALPDVAHTRAIAEVPGAYERRVTGFLDTAVLGHHESTTPVRPDVGTDVAMESAWRPLLRGDLSGNALR